MMARITAVVSAVSHRRIGLARKIGWPVEVPRKKS